MLSDTSLLTFGCIACAWMMLSYALESRSPYWTLGFAAGCAMTSIYSGLSAVWPICCIEGFWSFVALNHFVQRMRKAGKLDQALATASAAKSEPQTATLTAAELAPVSASATISSPVASSDHDRAVCVIV